MLFLGLALLFGGYSGVLYGWILILGYNISFAQLFVGPWPPDPGVGKGKSPVPTDPNQAAGADNGAGRINGPNGTGGGQPGFSPSGPLLPGQIDPGQLPGQSPPLFPATPGA